MIYYKMTNTLLIGAISSELHVIKYKHDYHYETVFTLDCKDDTYPFHIQLDLDNVIDMARLLRTHQNKFHKIIIDWSVLKFVRHDYLLAFLWELLTDHGELYCWYREIYKGEENISRQFEAPFKTTKYKYEIEIEEAIKKHSTPHELFLIEQKYKSDLNSITLLENDVLTSLFTRIVNNKKSNWKFNA